ncbi:hypothetical protein RUND412_006755 [Rhizina undulata]
MTKYDNETKGLKVDIITGNFDENNNEIAIKLRFKKWNFNHCMEELRRVMKEPGHNVKAIPERLRIVVRHRLVHKGKDAKRIVMDRPDGSTGYLGEVVGYAIDGGLTGREMML